MPDSPLSRFHFAYDFVGFADGALRNDLHGSTPCSIEEPRSRMDGAVRDCSIGG